jgi:hypothetical protein
MKLKLILIFTALQAFSGLVLACADGYYAGQGADSNSCYPIPGEGRQRGEKSGSPSLQPQPKQRKTVDTWGAIAIGSTKDGNRAMGAVNSLNNEREASKAAMEQCLAKGGGKTCNIVTTYYNQCTVIAALGETGYFYGANGATVEIATEQSMKECSAKHANCSVYYWGCSPAKWVF